MRPSHAYVPGQTPRHPEGAFDAVRDTAQPGMSVEALAASEAFVTGLAYLDQGYFWEAHELLEPVWMACPQNSAEQVFVRGVIQRANARLKERMGDEGITEVILALNATVDGQTTAHYIADELAGAGVSLTSLAQGVPIGGELDYLDDGTISAALRARKSL